jgi:hypothetical protein
MLNQPGGRKSMTISDDVAKALFARAIGAGSGRPPGRRKVVTVERERSKPRTASLRLRRVV